MDIDTVYIFYDTETTGKLPKSDDIISLGASYTRLEKDDSKEGQYYTFKKFDDFHTYIWTNKTIPDAAIGIHHITKERLKNMYYDVPPEMDPPPPEQAPEFPLAMQMLEEWVQKWNKTSKTSYLRVIWVAHNGKGFDDQIVFCNAVRHGVNIERFYQNTRTFGFLDTLPTFRHMQKHIKEANTEEERLRLGQNSLPRKSDTKKISYKLGDCYKSWCGGDELEGAHDALVDTLALIDCCNSSTIQPYVLPTTIMSFMIHRDKALQNIRSKVGRSYQEMETKVKRRKLVKDKDSQGSDSKICSDYDSANYCKFATLEEVHLKEVEDEGLIMCLTCVNMVERKNHENCPGISYPISNPL